MLARRAAAEVAPGDENRRTRVARLIQDERRIKRAITCVAPIVEQKLAEACALDALQELFRDNLIRVNVRPLKRRDESGVDAKGLHGSTCKVQGAKGKRQSLAFKVAGSRFNSKTLNLELNQRYCQCLTSVNRPVTAAAAAIAGLTRCVRPPRPCRPSKLRLLVEAQRSPGSSMSGFMPRHIEQPASRHSKPACLKMRSSPSASAARFTACEPGTTNARTFGFAR